MSESRRRKLNLTSVPEINESELELKEVIGCGNFAVVNFAKWNGKEVAVKRLEITAANTVERCKHEKSLMESITLGQNKNMVKLLAWSGDATHYSLVMPRMSCNLYEYIRTKPAPDWRTRYNILLQVATAVKDLHEQGIVHRDLKPENIFFTKTKLTPKLGDFGLSLTLDEMKVSFALAFTYVWAPPELVFNKLDLYDPIKADVYSYAKIMKTVAQWNVPKECVLSTDPAFDPSFTDAAIDETIRADRGTDLPDDTPIAVKNLVKQSFFAFPAIRPDMATIVETLQNAEHEICSDNRTVILK